MEQNERKTRKRTVPEGTTRIIKEKTSDGYEVNRYLTEEKWRQRVEYAKNFSKTSYTQLNIRLNNVKDKEIIDYINTIDNKRAYIMGLIIEDMKKKKNI